jgi:hypothetical protein
MNILIKTAAPAAVALVLAAVAAPALASTGPTFSTAKPWSGMSADSFGPDVAIFNKAEIGDLLHAKTVSVVKLDTAWNDGGDVGKVFDAVNNSDQAINLLREALKANPMAERLLARNHININTVVDITDTGDGHVQLYVS